MKRYIMLFTIIGTIFALDGNKDKEAMTELKPPKAEKIPHVLSAHGYDRIDNYYWMRLSDEQKLAKKPDAQTQKVLDNLHAENAFKNDI